MKVATVEDARRIVLGRVNHNRAAGTEAASVTALTADRDRFRFLVIEQDGSFGVVSVGPRGGLWWTFATTAREWAEIKGLVR